jgi:hypothetical protein
MSIVFQEHLQEVRNLPVKSFRLHIRLLIILVSWQILCRPKAKIFVQPSFGFTFNAIDIAASTRICVLTFKSVVNQIYGNVDESNILNNISDGSHLFLEPAITIRGGWKYVKLQLQASTASYLNNPDLHFEAYHLSIGLHIAIAKRYK